MAYNYRETKFEFSKYAQGFLIRGLEKNYLPTQMLL
jgi:hypothetical protein